MEDFLIVDGYNIINSWPNLVQLKNESLEHARDKLIEILQNYAAYKNINVILVFDAHLSQSKTRTSYIRGNIEIIYSKRGETADSVIEKLIDALPERVNIIVATSDWAEQRIVLGKGALRIPARELYIRVQETETKIRKKTKVKQENVNFLGARIDDHIRKKLEDWRRGI